MKSDQITIPALFEDSVSKFGDHIFLRQKVSDHYEGSTYLEIRKQVYDFGAGLMSLGIQKGDRIALLSEGRNEWVISELGVLYAGAINVPLSVRLNETTELPFRLAHSEARMLIVSGRQAGRILNSWLNLPLLEKIIILDNEPEFPEVLTFDQVIEKGREYHSIHPGDFNLRWQSIVGSDYANICYTSGTTADPKGIILTHRNYTANVEQAMSLMDIPSWFSTLLFLPWDHAFAHTAGIYTLMKAGGSLAAVQSGRSQLEFLKNIPVNIKETKPSFLLTAPAISKNFRKNIESGISAKGKVTRFLFKVGLKISYQYHGIGFDKGKNWRLLLKPLHQFFDLMIYRKIRESFGGSLKFCIGGAALLDIELQKFFYAIGIPVFQGYGLSEASPIIASNSEKTHKLGSSGYLVSDLKLKICDEDGNTLPTGQKGEIVIKGENVMAGYWKNSKATEETIKEGWLHTGDMGYLDMDGFLYVLGRFKSLLISDDGEKYSPEGVEEALINHSKLIDQCMLYNNQNAYTVCLIVVNRLAVKSLLLDRKFSSSTVEGAKHVIDLLNADIAQFRKGGKYEQMFPHRWIPSTFAILDQPFTDENRMINSTSKMVRGKIVDHYRERIDFLYTPQGKVIYNDLNINALRSI